ncbi:MAG: hypothetical protein IH921_15200, partial [Gemmatimonadetes bacterium]|nr:hypothetical protein [Gemmatimonadota bacterium]
MTSAEPAAVTHPDPAPSTAPLSVDVGSGPATPREILEPVGFECEPGDGVLEVVVPSYRSYDVTREIDLIEEVARLRGYETFQAELGPARPSSVPDHPLFILEDELRALLAGWGLFEVVNPAFSPASEGEVELNNPISKTESHLRTSLVPALV